MIIFIDFGLIFVVISYVSNSFFLALVSALWVKKEAQISLSIRQILPISVISFSTIAPAALIHFARLNPYIELMCITLMAASVYILSIRFLRLVAANEIRKSVLFLPERLATPMTKILIRIFVSGVEYSDNRTS